MHKSVSMVNRADRSVHLMEIRVKSQEFEVSQKQIVVNYSFAEKRK